MRRPFLSGLATHWRRAISFVAVFTIGALFGHRVIPVLYRDEVVYGIVGSAPKGCEKDFGLTPVRFGVTGQGIGTYRIPCDGRIRVSDTVQLQCDCD